MALSPQGVAARRPQAFVTGATTPGLSPPTAGPLFLDHGRVGEGRRVAQLSLLGHVAEEAAHDLAAPGLRQLGREDDVRRLRDRADLLAHVRPELLEHLDRAVVAAFQADVGDDRLAG